MMQRSSLDSFGLSVLHQRSAVIMRKKKVRHPSPSLSVPVLLLCPYHRMTLYHPELSEGERRHSPITSVIRAHRHIIIQGCASIK